jgi:hypothetical protein
METEVGGVETNSELGTET